MTALAGVATSALVLTGGFFLRADDPKVDLRKLPPAAVARMDYASDIRPIFERSCIRCHNSNRRGLGGYYKVGFRLDVGRDAAMEYAGVIVPGKSEQSRLIHHVARLADPMPPTDKDRLSAKEIGKLRAWIDQGAVWHRHAHKIPEGHRLVNVYVKEEFPADGGEKRWAEFAEPFERLGLKATLQVSEKKGRMFLSGGHLESPEKGRGWLPYIPGNTRKVRVFLPDLVAATVEVRIRDVKGKSGWVEKDGRLVRAEYDGKLAWSHAESDGSVLSPELEVGSDGHPVLEVRVVSGKKRAVGVSNIMVIAATGAEKK